MALSEVEFNQMIHLLERYADEDMDHRELWKLEPPVHGPVWITWSRQPPQDGVEIYENVSAYVQGQEAKEGFED